MDDTSPDAVERPVLGTSPAGAVSAGRSGGTWVAVGMAVANLLGYALNLVASRVLGPTGFGALGALLGVVLIGNVAALGLQTVTARVLAGTRGPSGAEASRLYRLALGSAVAVAGLTLAAAPFLAELLHLTGGGAVWWLPLVLAPLTITGVQLGILQGTERFRRLATLYVVAAAGKVGGGLVGVVVGDSVTATMAGTAIGAILSVLVGHGMVRGLLAPAAGGSPRAHLPELLHATQCCWCCSSDQRRRPAGPALPAGAGSRAVRRRRRRREGCVLAAQLHRGRRPAGALRQRAAPAGRRAGDRSRDGLRGRGHRVLRGVRRLRRAARRRVGVRVAGA